MEGYPGVFSFSHTDVRYVLIDGAFEIAANL